MDKLLKKLEILSDAAKYDASCSSNGSNRDSHNGSTLGVCHSWSADGRCVSLLKILLTNYCIYDCAYCHNRRSNDIKRESFNVDEVVDLLLNFYNRNYVSGLFLSSGVIKSPNYTMDMIYRIAKKLRIEKNFKGYLHFKAIPGADRELIDKTGLYVDRMSINIELPSDNSLKTLAPEKDKNSIIKPLKFIGDKRDYILNENRISKNKKIFVPAGHTTQMIIGATPESDKTIIKLSENIYNHLKLKRVYYSAYIPVNSDNRLPAVNAKPSLLREHRLYQADWLIRCYGFNADEIFENGDDNLSQFYDPKVGWALNNLDIFPIDITKASFNMLIRVPGIGEISAKRIVAARKHSYLTYLDLKKIGVVLKRAKFFISIKGKKYDSFLIEREYLENRLADRDKNIQLKLF